LTQEAQTKYFASNGSEDVSIEELLSAAFARWPIELCHGQGKNETGLGNYETRSWPGWHHHTALTFLAHHWLVLERNRLGEKIPRNDGGGSTKGLLRRFADGAPPTPEVSPTHAASAETEPSSPNLTLEEGPWEPGNAQSDSTNRRGSHPFEVHSIARQKTGQYP
jgi:hypothetical protein